MNQKPALTDSSQNHYAHSFRELKVYEEALELSRKIFQHTLKFPHEERYSLTDQIRRSSRSISANIAEAWGKREYQAHFISKLSDSLAETYETQCWLDHALDYKYITKPVFKELDAQAIYIASMLRNTAAKASSFCGKLPHNE